MEIPGPGGDRWSGGRLAEWPGALRLRFHTACDRVLASQLKLNASSFGYGDVHDDWKGKCTFQQVYLEIPSFV